MGALAQVLPSTGTTADPRDRRAAKHLAQCVLVVTWAVMVVVPWALQVRSFSALVARHKITEHLVPSPRARAIKTTAEIAAHCTLSGLHLAGIWYPIHASHYYESESATIDTPSLCHYIMPQYNAHGMYIISRKKNKPMYDAPKSCANDSYAFSYYYYHGGIGYYSLYTEGDGSFCQLDGTAYIGSAALGSRDINLNALAKFEGSSGYSSSYVYGCIGTLWLSFRVLVLSRSYLLCATYGRRLDALHVRISLSDAVVYVQQVARLAPHAASNWRRLGLLYLLIEGLMTDLFLVVAYVGPGAVVQYISLGYNIAGLLSMLFEILENSKLLSPISKLIAKRVLFNTEFSMWGELLYSIIITYYVTALNRSPLGPTTKIAEAASHYLWALFNHSVIVVGHTSFILAVRTIGTLVYTRLRYGSLKVLAMPCCVDSVMGYRGKLLQISGYEIHDSRLYYSKATLKAHGIFKVKDKGSEYLVCHKIYWLPKERPDLEVFGKLSGEHVDPWPESIFSGAVDVCDRRLGGATTADRPSTSSDEEGELESAPLTESNC